MSTLKRARGRWPEILRRLGVDPEYLTNRHGPCPCCGGKDRFRFDDRHGDGDYYCNQCGPGVGIILLRKLNDWDHATACRAIDRVLGDGPTSMATARPARKTSKADAIKRLLEEATCPGLVGAYLDKRGIGVRSAVLRGHRRCPYFDSKGVLVGRHPAVLAPITGPDGTLQSVQRIYDAGVDPRKKIMPAVANINGAAVRLHDATDELGVAEGVETALAAHQLFGIPVWAALSANGIKNFAVPGGVLTARIFGDNDSNFVGQNAAFTLAERLRRDGIGVEVHIPPEADTDWLDVLNGQVQP